MKKGKKGIIAAGIICLMLSGCGKENEVADDFQDVQGEVTTTEQGDQTDQTDSDDDVSATSGVQTVNYTIDSKVKVDAEVDTSIPDNVQVYDVSGIDVTDDFLRSMAAGFFDKGEYEVLKPEDAYSLSEQQAMLQELDVELKELAANGGHAYEPSLKLRRLAMYVENNISDVAYAQEDVIAAYETELESKKIAVIQGKINGTLYELYYSSRLATTGITESSIKIYPVAGSTFLLGYQDFISSENEGKDTDSMESDMISENKCDYNESLQSAQEKIKELGFDNYALANTSVVIEDPSLSGIVDGYNMNMGKEVVMNGYSFSFTPNMNGMGIGYYPITAYASTEYIGNEIEKSTDDITTLQPSVSVVINDTGIIAIEITSPIEIKESISSDTELLSFEQADVYAQEAFKETLTDFYQIGDIKLEYVIAKYDGNPVMIPAWVYYRKGAGDGLGMTALAVNALDGSVVYYSFVVHPTGAFFTL